MRKLVVLGGALVMLFGFTSPVEASWQIKVPELMSLPGEDVVIPVYGTTEDSVIAFQYLIGICDDNDSLKLTVDSITLKGYGAPYVTVFDTAGENWMPVLMLESSGIHFSAMTYADARIGPLNDDIISVIWAHLDPNINMPDIIELDLTEQIPCPPGWSFSVNYTDWQGNYRNADMLDGAIYVARYMLVFDPAPPHTVNESDSLFLNVIGYSIDSQDVVEINLLSGPDGWVSFTPGSPQNPTYGTLSLTPGSCDDGQYVITFKLHSLTYDTSVFFMDTVNVLNVNTPPRVESIIPGSAFYTAGNVVHEIVRFTDEDAGCPVEHATDSLILSFSIDPVPSYSTPAFTDNGDGVGELVWTTDVGDTGRYVVSFVAQDLYGAADTATIEIYVVPGTLYPQYSNRLQLKEMCGNNMEEVYYPVYLSNSEPIEGYNVLLAYDPSCLTLKDVVENEIGGYHCEYFGYAMLGPGAVDEWPAVRVEGSRNVNNGKDVPPIPPGDDNILFYLVFDVHTEPVMNRTCDIKFIVGECGDNSLTDTSGVLYVPEIAEVMLEGDSIGGCAFAEFNVDSCGSLSVIKDLALVDGFGWVEGYEGCCMGETCPIGCIKANVSGIGDVNLNGIPFEISDVTFFVNVILDFFQIDSDTTTPPRGWTMTQWGHSRENSDLNQNGNGWELSDFILLVNIVNGYNTLLGGKDAGGIVRIWTEGADVNLAASSDIGAILLTVEYDGEIRDIKLGKVAREMTLSWNKAGNELKVLIWSEGGRAIKGSEGKLLEIIGDARYRIKKVVAADPLGNSLSAELGERTFALRDVVPNPFKSKVEISYVLSNKAFVKLGIYDVSGRLIRMLADKRQEAGEYTVIWDGRDERGHRVGNGVYFVRLKVGKDTRSRRILLLR